jgi:flagellar protein FlaG
MEITGVNGLPGIPAATPAPAALEHVAENRDIVQAVKALNAAQSFGDQNEITFSLDRNTRQAVIRIVDRQTQELVSQIPPEYVLRLAEDLKSSGA